MNEAEVNGPEDAAFFLSNEVVNEYHSFPAVSRDNIMYINLNGEWYELITRKVASPDLIQKLEDMHSW